MATRKYTLELLKEATSKSKSLRESLRYLGAPYSSGTIEHIAKMIQKFEIDCTHFTRQPMSRNPSNKLLTAEEILIRIPENQQRMKAYLLRRALQEMGVEEKCNRCGQGNQWQGKFIRLEINHIDGDWLNCLFENVEYICPNCHSQETETNKPHKNRNKL